MSSCSEGSYNRKRQHGDDENIIDVDNDTSESEDEGSDVSCPPLKKVRVSASAVHKEFEEVKDKSGKWSSKCKHCTIKDTVYSHKMLRASSFIFRRSILKFTRSVWRRTRKREMLKKENVARKIYR